MVRSIVGYRRSVTNVTLLCSIKLYEYAIVELDLDPPHSVVLIAMNDACGVKDFIRHLSTGGFVIYYMKY